VSTPDPARGGPGQSPDDAAAPTAPGGTDEGPGRSAVLANVASQEFPTSSLVTREMLVDSGLPAAVFITVYSVAGQQLRPAVVAAVACAAVLMALRLWRREPLQHVLAGFIGVAIAAFLAARTGQAEAFFLPGLLINLAYFAGYLISIAVRWPLLGVLVGLATGEGMAWRQDPRQLRAYTLASWFWVAMFGLRIAVQLPLYLAGQVVALGVARLAMGWPLFLLCLYLSWVVVRRARQEQPAVPS